jgi:hypothetical protein
MAQAAAAASETLWPHKPDRNEPRMTATQLAL